MTVVVLGIIAVPVSFIVVQHLEATFQASQKTVTMNLARHAMERLKNIGYDSLPTGTRIFSNYEGSEFDVATVISKSNYGPEGLATINVYILETGTLNILARLITYRTNNVTYGT